MANQNVSNKVQSPKDDVSDYIEDFNDPSSANKATNLKPIKGKSKKNFKPNAPLKVSPNNDGIEVTKSQNSPLPEWTCKIDGSPKDQQWTVGEIFHLECEGPKAEFLSTELTTILPEKAQYQLKILDVEGQTENSLVLKVTSYNPGRHTFENLEIADQKVPVLKVKPFGLEIKSVIEQPTQKPYGPVGAFKMVYPNWLWAACATTLILVSLFSIFKLRRRAQMKRVIDELKQHNTALGPFNQFNKDIRLLGRQYIFGKQEEWPLAKKERYIESIDEIFRMYILREFWVPALDWNSNLVAKTLLKQDRKGYSNYGDELLKCLKELDRAKNDSSKLKNHDCKQLTQMATKVSQAIWKMRKH